MSRNRISFNMLYIILVLVLIITQGESYPKGNQRYEGNPEQGIIDPRNHGIRNRHEQVIEAPSKEKSYSTYVPLIDGSPIYIPDMKTDLRMEQAHRIDPITSWRHADETSAFPNRLSSIRRQHHPKTQHHSRTKHHIRGKELPTRPFGTRRRKPVFHERPIVSKVDYETPVKRFTKGQTNSKISEAITNVKPSKHIKHEEIAIPEYKEYHPEIIEDEYDHPVVVEALTKKEKSSSHVKPSIHVKPDESEEMVDPEYKEYHPEVIIEDEYDHPAVVEVLTKKEKPVHHVKPSIHVKPDEIVVPEYKGYHPEIVVENEYEHQAVVETLAKKKHDEPEVIVVPDYKGYHPDFHEEEYDHPVVVVALTKKEKPSIHVKPDESKEIVDPEYKEYHPEVIIEDKYDHPAVVEVLTKKEKPIHHVKPSIHVKPDESEEIVDPEYKEYHPDRIIEDEYDHPAVVEVLTKKEKPVHHVKPSIHVKPDESEEIVDPKYKEYHPEIIVEDEYDHPVVVEALTKKKKLNTKVKPSVQIKPDHPDKTVYPEHILVKRESGYEYYENYESPDTKTSVPVTDDIDGFNIGKSFSNLNSFLEGSGSIPEEITGRSFLPVDPNIWSLMSNIHAQERQKFKKCFTPKQETGNCMPIQLCSISNVATGIEDLLNNVCVIDEVFIGICCPEFPVDTIRVDWDQFEEKQNIESFNNSETAIECGKFPSPVNQTVAWPWMAPLVAVSTGNEFCGGALIKDQYVLSAAHCTTKIPLNRILIRLGPLNDEKKSEDFEVVEIKRHKEYNSRTLQNDIALLKLSRRVRLGDFRRLICLPDDKDYTGETGILLGSNGFSEKTEELESLAVMSNQECQNKMGVSTSDAFLCTMPRKEDSKCNDDSGAPLLVGEDKQFKMVGILTWSRNDCDGRFPSKFTRVSKYRKWIENHAV